MAALRMALTGLLVLAGILSAQAWMTEYDKRFTFSCHNNQFISGIESVHDSRKEDRVFNFACRDMPTDADLNECKWSGYQNDYDHVLNYHCPEEKVIVGLHSVHDSHKEDRKFAFLCCRPGSYILHNCAMTGYVNEFDGHLKYHVPTGKFLRGVYSVHNSKKEDRRFRFDVCDLDFFFHEGDGGNVTDDGNDVLVG